VTASARLLVLLFATAVLAGVPRVAGAALDPSHAQADVDAVMAEKQYTFCREPRQPLSAEARALCPHAAEIQGCQGFAAACSSFTPEENWGPKVARFFSRITPEFVKEALRAIFKGFAGLTRVIFLLIVAAAAIAFALAAARAVRRHRADADLRSPSGGPSSAAESAAAIETTDEDELLALADDHARKGRLGAALQLYLAACLRALDRRGAVRLARDRTNGEYVRSCAEDRARPALAEIVREVDRVQFGHAAVSRDVVSRAAQLAVGIVRTAPLLLLVVALPALVGCGWKAPSAGDDPAGDELLYDVLRRQGVSVEALDSSLSSIPLPEGKPVPAILIDAERTPLDDDAETHLVEWVRAGGILVLAGAPERWPHAFGAKRLRVEESHGVHAQPHSAVASSSTTTDGELADPYGFDFDAPAVDSSAKDDDDDDDGEARRVAWLDNRVTYAATLPRGRGVVLGIATDELLTNAGLARPHNAATLVEILSNTGSDSFAIAQPQDGTAPPSSPVSAMTRAGLGLPLVHGLFAAAVLFLAAGTRLTRPRPVVPQARRAFSEHVEAVGALYARTHSAPHALAAYARFVEQRLRARMPRGAGDVAAFLASRSRLPLETCQQLWARATATTRADPKNQRAGDELMVLKELSAAYAAATAQDK
jgi:hypothetical protein